MHAHKERPEGGSVYAWNKAMKDIFTRCLMKTAVQVCTLTIYIVGLYLHVFTFYDSLVRLFSILLFASAIPASRRLICNTNWCLFLQVKNKP
jgi:hypothetical protein